MKHILKPVGHCLATAVISSTLLRVYPASIANASTTPDPPLPTTREAAQPAVDSGDAGRSPAAVVGSPTAPATVGSTVESIVAPEVAGAVAPSSPAADAASNAAESVRSSENQPAASSPTTATPEATPAQTAETSPSSSLSKQTAKQSAAQPETLAAIRQQLEQKLAAIVARDRVTREAELQQNLMRVALQYAETGAFEPARQVARHPALPLDLQTALLAQIDQMAAGTADQTDQTKEATQPQATAASPSPTEAGRTVPGDAIAYVPLGQSWTGAFPAIPFAGQQCPIPAAPAAEAAVSARPNPHPDRNAASKKASPPSFGNRAAATLVTAVLPSVERSALKPARSTDAQSAAAQSAAARPSTAQLPIVQSATTKPAAASAARQTLLPRSATVAQQPATPSASLKVRLKAGEFDRLQPVSRSQPAMPQAEPQAENTNSLAVQPASPLEIMGYWMSKPLKEAGIRLPLMPALFSSASSASQTDREAAIAPIEANSTDPFPALSPFATGWEESTDLPQPALRFSPYLLDLRQSLADLQFGTQFATESVTQSATKDAVKSSPPSVQVSSKAVRPATAPAQTATLDCFVPIADSGSVALSPASARQMGWGNFIFPLPIPAALTSAFGWRVHPIFGDRRFHAGIDLGAPMGTPVVAAKAGRVVAADSMGGYGLAVVVETIGGSYRNLYAHLSGIAVRPGATVPQGAVLGWVGSTGNSTGPHLHFETQVPTANGWMAIDPLSAVAERIADREVGR